MRVMALSELPGNHPGDGHRADKISKHAYCIIAVDLETCRAICCQQL